MATSGATSGALIKFGRVPGCNVIVGHGQGKGGNVIGDRLLVKALTRLAPGRLNNNDTHVRNGRFLDCFQLLIGTIATTLCDLVCG